MRSMIKRGLLAFPALLVMCLALWSWLGVDRGSPPPSRLATDGLLTQVEGLARQFPAPSAESPGWPAGLASRPEHFTESWLVAGLLRDAAGQRYGFQLAFDRVAMAPEPAARESSWATRDVFRAMFSVEPEGREAVSFERVSRGALQLAGADAGGTARAWVEDWELVADESGQGFRILASAGGAGLSLHLALPVAPPAELSHELFAGYWQLPLAAEGQIEVAGEAVEVTGTALVERLWGRAQPAGRGQLAMARIWVHRASGEILRCEQLQRRGGGGTPLLDCFSYPAGRVEEPQLEIDPRGWQQVGVSRVPLRWMLGSPGGPGSLSLEPIAAQQALLLDGTWRGILRVEGHQADWGLLVLSNFAAP
jgi:predicted secreted hydrolase